MITPVLLSIFLLAADDAAPGDGAPAAKYEIGDRVVVIHETPLRADERAVKQLAAGTWLTVEERQDGYLGVTSGRQGWVDEKDVIAADKALKPLGDLIASDPDNLDLRRARSALAVEQRKWALAIDDYSQLIRLEPDEWRHYLERGSAYSEEHDWDRSLKDFDDAVRLSNDDTDALMMRGAALDEKGDHDKALADFNAALKREEDEATKAELLRRRGSVFADMHDFEKAMADFQEALKLDPAEPWIFYSRAQANITAGKLDDAIKDLSAAIYLRKTALLYSARGDVYRRKQEFENAQFNFDQALKVDPNSEDAWNGLAMLHQTEGKFEKAVEDYRSLLKSKPDDYLAYNNLAWLFATSTEDTARNGKLALENAKKAVELSDNKLPWIIDTLAASYAETGDFDKAIETQQQAIELTTDPKQRNDLRTRLDLYQQHKPYREKPGADHSD